MRKFVTLVLASLMLGTTPIMAAESGGGQLPKALKDLGITSEDLKDVDKAVVDESTKSEADIMQRRWRRYCPRGYHLEAYRIRIGRFVIVRYRCVRGHHRGDWYNVQQDNSNQQLLSIPEEVEPLTR